MPKGERIHFKPESAFMLTSPESRELAEKKEIEFVADSKSGKILKIGDPREVRQWLDAERAKDKGLIITPEQGGVALPGFTDAHHHLLYGTLDVIQAGYVFGIDSAEKMVESIRSQAKDGDPRIPKVFLGHNTTRVPKIYKGDLDEASTERPVCLLDLSFHGVRLNSKMLELVAKKVEEEKRTSRKLSGYLDKKTGQATEGHAVLAIQIAEAFYGVKKIAEGMRGKLDEWIGQGITDIHELFPLSWSDLEATLLTRKEWGEEKKTEFPVRQIFMTPFLLEELARNQKKLERAGLFDPEKDWGIMGVKLLADGSFGSHTVLLKKPYVDTGKKGIEYHTIKELNEALKMVKDMGLNRIAMHAIGDAAVERALNTARKWKKLAESAKMDPGKFRIEHFEFSAGKAKEAADLGVWINSEPNFLTDYVYKDRLSGRVTQICPHAEIIENGAQMHFGSDGMPTSALFGIWAATHNPNKKERISFEQALAAYSLMGADYEHETGHNPNRGRLAEGASADVVVVNRETLNKMLKGEGSPEEFARMGAESAVMGDKVTELEAGIMKIYRQGRLVKEKK